MFALCFVAADAVPRLLFGNAYHDSGEILLLLSLGFFTNAALGVNQRILKATGRMRTLLSIDLLGMVVSLGLSLWLVSQFGAIGGAWSILLSFALQSLASQVAVLYTTTINPFSFRSLAPFAFGLALAGGARVLVVVLPPSTSLQIILATIVSVVFLLASWGQLALQETFPELGRVFARLRSIVSGRVDRSTTTMPSSDRFGV